MLTCAAFRFLDRRLDEPSVALVARKYLKNAKREYEKSLEPFVLSLEHKQSYILARRQSYPLASTSKF